MITAADNELASITDAAGARRWLASLPDDSLERLSAIGRLLVRLGRPDLSVDTTLAILEPTRVALIRAADACLDEVAARQLPYGADAWRSVADSLTTLRAMRTLYKRAGSRISREIQARVAGVEMTPGEGTGTTMPAVAALANPASIAATVALPASTAMGSLVQDDASRAALPLLRALDVQSRVVEALLAHRIEPLPEDWDELCLLASHARAAGLLDAQIPDVLPLVRPVTARALFVYPLLLRLAELPRRSRTEAALTERLASRLAGQVGLRIDAGVSKKNPYGPTLALSPASSVRLDTHRIPGGLEKRRKQWSEAAAVEAAAVGAGAAEAGAVGAAQAGAAQAGAAQAVAARASAGAATTPAQISGESLLALIDDLHACWAPEGAGGSAASMPPPSARENRAEPPMHAFVLAFGLPRRSDANGVERGRSTSGKGARYEYGEWEQNTILRVSRVARVGEQRAAQDPDPMARAETVHGHSLAGDRLSVERRQLLPAAQMGGLVALCAERGAAAGGFEPAGDERGSGGQDGGERDSGDPATAAPHRPTLRLGTVAALVQLPESGYARIGSHRLDVALWPGQARAVAVRHGAAKVFDDAWLLSPSGDEAQSSLVVSPGLAAIGARARMRAGDRELSLRFTSLLGRGPGYERYGFAADRGDGTDAR